MYRTMKWCVASCLLIPAWPAVGQIRITTNVTENPQKAEFVLDDVHNFIRVEKLLSESSDMLVTLQSEYLDKGTPGLAMFIEKYDLTAERLAKAIKKRREKYATLSGIPEWLVTQKKPLREALVRYKHLVPSAVFPPTYFVVAGYRGIGSGSPEGQLISVEKWEPPKKTLDTLIVHELTHFQQLVATGPDEFYAVFGPKKTLLALTIREGTAEFIAYHTTKRITQDEAWDYVIEHEKELWERFQPEMLERETGDWMWKTPSDLDQPPHVAYMIGFRIVEAYYNAAEDKGEAMREILAVTDYPLLLKRSGYGEKFAD